MLRHAEAHSRAFAETTEQFIDGQRLALGERMRDLKRLPAIDPTVAVKRWNEELTQIMGELARGLYMSFNQANQKVDNPDTLRALGSACNGRMERSGFSAGREL
jgi:hypothetical protein